MHNFNIVHSKPVEAPKVFRWWLGQSKKGGDNMVDQSLDARRIADAQESRISASAAIAVNAAKPLFELQTAMLRFWAHNLEVAARNYENWLGAFTGAIEQQHEQARDAAE
jgi:hypothetical protein